MRPLLPVLVLLLAAPLAEAQITFGAKAGLNAATLRADPEPDLGDQEGRSFERTPRLGLAAGVWARVPLSPRFSVQAEALYSQKGTRTTDEIVDFRTQETDIDLAYVEIPVLARFAPEAGGALDVGLYAGPSLGVKVAETWQFRVNGEDTSELTGQYTSTDLGVALGADVGSGPFAVDLRYTLGLTNVSDPQFAFGKRGGEIDLGTERTGTFTAAFVYRFGP